MAYYGNAPIFFGSVSMVTATLGSNDPALGTVREEGDERYLFVYNTGSSTAGVGAGVTVSGVTDYSVTVSSITHTDVPVGVVKHAAIPTGSYGWVMLRGFSPYLASVASAVATGNALTLGADGNWAALSVQTAYSQVNSPVVYGKAMTSAACAASTGYAYFRIA